MRIRSRSLLRISSAFATHHSRPARIQPSLRILLLIFALYGIASQPAAAQAATTGGTSSSLLAELSSAISGSKPVQQVQLSGNATWYTGGSQGSGTVTLVASAGGSWQMQLVVSSIGQRTESQTGAGSNADCQWRGADGVAHEIDPDNCWRPTLWFFPAISLQPSQLSSYLVAVDLGTGPVGSSANIYRHLQSQLLFTGLPSTMATDIAKQSTTNLGLDPTSLFPAVLAYSVRPDSGASTPIAMEIHYSDYRAVNGTQIPFHIQRYVNGYLQLDILLNSAQVN